ncbi:MAG: SURF1 family protein [Pseudomonadota bacterium]|nr:SURF1 family protein [Pseudomonadota bacterium]
MNRQLTFLNFRLLLFTVFFLVVFVRLGFWQLERAEEKEAQRIAQAVSEDAQPMTLSQAQRERSRLSGQLIEDRGRFLEETVFLRDNVIFQGTVGFEVMRLFRSEAGDIALVNFGFVPGGSDRSVLPSVPALTGVNALSGRVYFSEWASDAGIELYTGWPRITPTQSPLANGNLAGLSLLPFIVRLDVSHPDALPRFWPLTVTSAEKHRGYAVQWFLMAVALLTLFIVFTWKQYKEQRASSPAHATKEMDGHERRDAK